MEVSGYAKMYLEWLAENEPEYLRYLLENHQLNKLEHQIDQKLAQAALVIDQQQKGGNELPGGGRTGGLRDLGERRTAGRTWKTRRRSRCRTRRKSKSTANWRPARTPT